MPLSRTQKSQCRLLAPARHVNLRRALGAELDGVADQVLKDVGQLIGVGPDDRQRVRGDDRAGFLDQRLEILQRLLQRVAGVGGAGTLPRVPTREYSSRSLISACMRVAPSTAALM